MIKMIIELVGTKVLLLPLDKKIRRQRNGVSLGSVLAPLLFNIYTCVLLSTIFSKFAIQHCCTLLETERTWKSRHDYSFGLSLDLDVAIRFFKDVESGLLFQ